MKYISFALLTIFNIYTCLGQSLSFKRINFTTEYKLHSEIQGQLVKDTLPWKHQISAADYATKGDYKNALAQWDIAMPGRDNNYTLPEIDSINSQLTLVNAQEYIIEAAANEKLIIINEAHHNARHRVFTRSLLKELYELGYTSLGLEALGNGTYLDSELNERKFPIASTGYYIKDPQFSNLVREALNIGYELFAYECTNGENGKDREIAQAANISKYITDHPDKKVLIHCGFDHALEGKHNQWEKAMAARVKDNTGIDPLTINQVLYSEKGNHKFNHKLLKALVPARSSIAINQDGVPLKYERKEAYCDIAVFHPNTKYINDRANWLTDDQYKIHNVSIQELEIQYPIMVMAFDQNENHSDRVPCDIIEINEPDTKANLILKKGNYEIIITNKIDSYSYQLNLN